MGPSTWLCLKHSIREIIKSWNKSWKHGRTCQIELFWCVYGGVRNVWRKIAVFGGRQSCEYQWRTSAESIPCQIVFMTRNRAQRRNIIIFSSPYCNCWLHSCNWASRNLHLLRLNVVLFSIHSSAFDSFLQNLLLLGQSDCCRHRKEILWPWAPSSKLSQLRPVDLFFHCGRTPPDLFSSPQLYQRTHHWVHLAQIGPLRIFCLCCQSIP